MNAITKSLMSNFLQSQEFPRGNEPEDFEKFAAYSILRKVYGQEFDLDDILIGEGEDTGIDALAILVNGSLVNSIEDIQELEEKNNYLDVSYIFIQAKTSSSFEVSNMGTFCRGVEDFFLGTYKLRRNEKICHKLELHNFLMDRVISFSSNPQCMYYYVCTGYWDDSLQDQRNILENTKNVLTKASMFSHISYKICGANEINSLYKEATKQLAVQILFSSKATLPPIPSVQSSHIGVLPISEFRKLILDDDGYLRNVYEDNIRDFQELSNPVNRKISETIEGEFSLFPLLNNGITIVADKIKQTGDTLILYDYQIVNGCQTSNIIAHHCKNTGLMNLLVPVKIIETNDEATKNKITFATNNQTPVKREQFAALTQFQRTLEDFYNASTNEPRIVYERRSNQYATSPDIRKARIITIPNQIKSFAAMFLRYPHRVTSYYGELTKNLAKSDSEIFNPKHQPLTYYLAGLALYRLETLFKNATLSCELKKIRYFILLGFLLTVISDKFTKQDFCSAKPIEKKLAPLKEILTNAEECTKRFIMVANTISDSHIVFTKDALKTADTTKLIVELFDKATPETH